MDRTEIFAGIGFLVFMSTLLLSVGYLLHMVDKHDCETRWKDSGLRSEYRVDNTCLVEIREGVWVPESAVKLDVLPPKY